MPAPLPHRYSASLCRSFASRARIEVPPCPAAGSALLGGSPPALDGDADAWSPEHMLLSSLGLCMLTTFEAFAARDGIDLREWRAQVSGMVELTPEGPNFTSIVLELDLDIAGNIDRLEDALEEAKRCCLVHNALRVPVVVETRLRTPFGAFADLSDLAELPHPPAPPAPPAPGMRRQLCAV
jgi:organic hydroperoxide reductase OsmC/OhrA